MKLFLIAWAFLIMPGCAIYQYESGDCKLSIYSMREMQASDLNISESCALTGGAEQMSYNEKQMLIFNELVKKIP